MINRGRVIKGLEFHKSGLCDNKEGKICPYWLHNKCLEELCTDALALLKEQKPVKPIYRMEVLETHSGKLYRVYACGKCNAEFKERYAFCPSCGQAVKWDETLKSEPDTLEPLVRLFDD